MIAAEKWSAAIRTLRIRSVQAPWLPILALSAFLLTLPLAIPLNGEIHADWLQFLGRFHPSLVHLPIGMLVLLVFLEFTGRNRTGLRDAGSFVLQLGFVTAFLAVLFGILLAYGSGVTGVILTRHMWGGVVLLIELLVCISVRPTWISRKSPRKYPALLAVSFLTLIWTAHQGGSLTHGSDYLTRYMPGPLKEFFPSAVGASDAPYVGSAYARYVHPILDAKCVGCHGASKEQARLRLDFYDLIIKGGKDGAVIVPRNPDGSLLLQRVTLAPTDRHFMPTDGKPPLSPDEIATLRGWILSGASPTATGIPGISKVSEIAELPIQPVGDYSPLMNEIRQMQRSEGAKLVAVSAKPSDGLILRTLDVASNFDDAQLAQFQRFAPYIVEAELARTAVTDACFDTLSKFTNLRALHLEGTAVTGQGLAKLSNLSQLTYVNLSATKVTPGAVAPLKSMPNLRHLYLFETAAQPEAAAVNGGLNGYSGFHH